MRLATWVLDDRQVSGPVIDGFVHPFADGLSLTGLLESGGSLSDAAGQAAAGPGTPLADVRLLPPVAAPSVRDFITFFSHLEGVVQRFGHQVPEAWFAAPTFYFSNPHSLVGAHDDVPIPPGCRIFDFELEVAAVIGRAGRDLTPAQAREHIVGYVVMNDWSARDLQAREMAVQLGPAKGKDSATTLGPWLVTADELEPFRDAEGFLELQMTVRVNGDPFGSDYLTNMAWTFEELVAYASRGTWVRPGDVLGSGTCGSGCLAEVWGRTGRQDPPSLQLGDIVTMTVTGLGEISNRVVAGTDGVDLPTARVRLARAMTETRSPQRPATSGSAPRTVGRSSSPSSAARSRQAPETTSTV